MLLEVKHYSFEMIESCFQRASYIQLEERLAVTEELTVTAYYAGHVQLAPKEVFFENLYVFMF